MLGIGQKGTFQSLQLWLQVVFFKKNFLSSVKRGFFRNLITVKDIESKTGSETIVELML